MSNNGNVLIIGEADRIEILSVNTEFDITFEANYEEATKLLQSNEFGLVITAALLPGKGSGHDVVMTIKSMVNKPNLIVCHPETVCRINDLDWHISRSLEGYFGFGNFHQGTIDDLWLHHDETLRLYA
jgi:hypothetical protein